MKYSLVITAFIAMIGITGCGYKEGVVTPDQKAYLYFSGNVTDVKVSVDNSKGFQVEEGKNHQYKINPGKHTVKIYRGNEMIINRDIFVSDGVGKEIEVQPWK